MSDDVLGKPPRTCAGLTSAGAPCGSRFGLSPDGLCINHDPARRDAIREAKAMGGRAAGAAKRAAREERAKLALGPDDVPPMPKTLADAAKYFAWLVDAGANRRLDARTVHECTFALKGFETAVKSRDLEERVKELVKASHVTKDCPKCGPRWAKALGTGGPKP